MKGELSFGESHFAAELEGKEGVEGPYRGGLESAAVKRIQLARGSGVCALAAVSNGCSVVQCSQAAAHKLPYGCGGLAPGEVFARSFNMALSLGCLSPRRLMVARQKGYAPNALTVQRPVTCWAKEVAQWSDWHTVLADTDLTTSSSSTSSATSATAAAAASADLSTATPPQAVVVAAALLSPEPSSTTTTSTSIKTAKKSKNNSKSSISPLVTRPKSRNFQTRYWRWNGWLCRYGVGGRIDDADAPAVVLVHGFGASADQWDRCFAELGSTHRVYAVDMIGFGHSSKPPLTFRLLSGSSSVLYDCSRARCAVSVMLVQCSDDFWRCSSCSVAQLESVCDTVVIGQAHCSNDV
eukprot:19483-Heterococcus_DN1.PRE.2